MRERLVWALLFILLLSKADGQNPVLRLIRTIPLSRVQGRIDHMAIDLAGQRLFVAARGNNSVEIIDLRSGRRISSILGLKEPQGIVYVPQGNKIFVANGGDGRCQIFDGQTFKLITSLDFAEDADNLRYDSATGLVYVGYGRGAIGLIDAKEDKKTGQVNLSGHPESFQLEKNGDRIFVNIPSVNQVAVIERKKAQVVAEWPLKDLTGNFPMALDQYNHRLLVGCRKPPALVVFNTDSGSMVGSYTIERDPDDIFYDQDSKRIYISCGGGTIEVFQQLHPNRYELLSRIPTAPGARTSLFVPELGQFYLAVPQSKSQGAEIRVYEIRP